VVPWRISGDGISAARDVSLSEEEEEDEEEEGERCIQLPTSTLGSD
jgi:hypothetical protein